MTASFRQVQPQVARESPAAFRVPLFEELVRRLDATGRHVVLDLGAASTETLALLGRSHCRVEIVDLAHFGGIELLNNAERGRALADAAESLLPKRLSDHEVDVVFCWDLPNYLTLDALSGLMSSIRRRARLGAVAHALICYSDHDMNERPGRFVPTADDELVDHSDPGATIPAPRYSHEDLCENMGGFVADRARLLGNGMQEFLFRLES